MPRGTGENHVVVRKLIPAGAPPPVVLTSMELRRFVKRLLDVELPEVVVLSYHELDPGVNIQPVGRISVGG